MEGGGRGGRGGEEKVEEEEEEEERRRRMRRGGGGGGGGKVYTMIMYMYRYSKYLSKYTHGISGYLCTGLCDWEE